MSFTVDRGHKPMLGAKAVGLEQKGSPTAFLDAIQKAAPAPAAPRQAPSDAEAQLIGKLRHGVTEDESRKRWDLVLDEVKPFLDGQPPSERQATVQRLLDAFKEPPGGAPGTTSAELRSSWVRQGIEGAAALLGLTTDPAEMARREQEEQFAASIFARGNRLEHHPDEAGDDPAAIAKDIRAFLGGPAGGGPGAEKKWTVLNRLYERDWVDAGPVMVAIEKIAAEDFHRELVPSQHRGPGAYEAAQSIYSRAVLQEGRNIALEKDGIPNQQYLDLKKGSRHASPEVQLKLAQMVSQSHWSIRAVSAFVTMPLSGDAKKLQENGLEVFRRLEDLTKDMAGPLATEVVDQALTEMKSIDGLPKPLNFAKFEEGSVAERNKVRAVVDRIAGTPAGTAVVDRMRELGILV